MEIGSCARCGLTNYFLTNDVPFVRQQNGASCAFGGEKIVQHGYRVNVFSTTFCGRSVAVVVVAFVRIGCYWFVMNVCAVRSSCSYEMPMRVLVPHA